ncbi:MAG: insulinase family protein [Candidatus Tectomicrobia bacterium]|nr:insulinase family protein [Candidatus Tectomicrobia bacterium]
MAIRKDTLSNGIRLVTHQRTNTEAVAFHIYFGCGGRHEPDEVVGLSHALEHMMFKGTPTRTYLQIAQEMEGVGATINADTGPERTSYHFVAPAEVVPKVLAVYADAVNNSLLDPGEWEKERRVILEELKMYEDMPRFVVSDRLETTMFNLQVGVIGSRETIGAIRTEHMRRLIADWYRPVNTVISVAGRLEHEKIWDLAEAHFGTRSSEGGLPRVPELPKKSKERVCGVVRQTDQVNLAFGFRALGRKHPDLAALRLMNDILGGKMSSRLFDEVREKRGLAYSVHSRAHRFTDTGYLELKAGVALEKAVEAARVSLAEAARLRDEPVSEEELESAKKHLRGLLLVQEESDVFAERNGESWLLEGEVRTLAQELEALERVGREDVRRVAADVFRNEELTAAFVAERDLSDDLAAVLAL